MKRVGTFVATCFLFSVITLAQNIPNYSFERWYEPAPLLAPNLVEPEGWVTSNILKELGDISDYNCDSVRDSYSGTYAIRCLTIEDTFAGGFTGTPDVVNQTVDFGYAYSSAPTSLKGFLKYIPAGVDTGVVGISLSRWNSEINSREPVAAGQIELTDTINSYQSFSVPINYVNCPPPDTAVITFATTTLDNPPDSTVIKLDSLHYEYDTVSNNQAPVAGMDTARTKEDSFAYIMPLENDSDPDNDSLFLGFVSQAPDSGVAERMGDTMKYTPNPGFSGKDTFYYRVFDNDTPPNCGIGRVVVTVEEVSGIQGHFNKRGTVELYPNPASKTLHLEVSQNLLGKRMILYNAMGVEQKRIPINKMNQTMNVSGLGNGLYIYQIVNEEGLRLQRGKVSIAR